MTASFSIQPTKRVKTGSLGVATAAASMVTSEPALLMNIIQFLPSAPEEERSDQHASPVPRTVVKTIAALSRAIPGLSRFVGPSNEPFWRDMVLTHFDFTVGDKTFNVKDYGGSGHIDANGDALDGYDDDAPDDDDEDATLFENDPCDDSRFAEWHRHPLNGPCQEWNRDHPYQPPPPVRPGHHQYHDVMLVEDLHFWPSLQSYFPPAAYGFLGRIQHDKTRMATEWPPHEDAFSLFCDLLVLPHFLGTHEGRWLTHSDGEALVYPCIRGRFPTRIAGRGFAMLRFCGIRPLYWLRNDQTVSERWTGLDGPSPSIVCKRDETKQGFPFRHSCESVCETRTKEESTIFPDNWDFERHPFQTLRQFVHATFSDWRRIQVNYDEEASPDFYIGSTKRSGRWLGFVGESQYLYP